MRYWMLYVAGVILVTDAGVLYASESIGITAASAARIAHILLWLAASSYTAVLVVRTERTQNASDMAGASVFLAVLLGPSAAIAYSMLHGGRVGSGWIVLAIVAAVIVCLSHLGTQATAIQIIAAIWAIATLVVQLGLTPVFAYARTFVAASRAIHFLIDVRIATGALVVAVLLATAVSRAVREGAIDVDDLPEIHMPPPPPGWNAVWTSFMRPIIGLIDLALQIVWFFVNLGWKVLVVVVVFFVRIGEALIMLLAEIVMENQFARAVTVAGLSWVGSLAMFAVACKFTHSLGPYILAPTAVAAIRPLAVMLGCGAVIALMASFLVFLSDPAVGRQLPAEGTFVFSNFLAVVLIASVVLMVLARIDALQLAIMRRPGIYTRAMFLIMISGALAWLGKGRPSDEPQKRVQA